MRKTPMRTIPLDPDTPPAAPAAGRFVESPASPTVHRHRIDVETEEEAVHVTLGKAADSPEPRRGTPAGGFAKFFNRVIDTGAWARLPDAGRAVYMPLVRLGDATSSGSARARVGLASLMRHTGLSRSTVKRGLKSLQEARLIVVVSQGGVSTTGQNRPNVYELLVPEPLDEDEPATPPTTSAARAKRGGKTPARPTPPGVHGRTPSGATADPPGNPPPDRPPVRPRSTGRSTADPQLRASPQTHLQDPPSEGPEVGEVGEVEVGENGESEDPSRDSPITAVEPDESSQAFPEDSTANDVRDPAMRSSFASLADLLPPLEQLTANADRTAAAALPEQSPPDEHAALRALRSLGVSSDDARSLLVAHSEQRILAAVAEARRIGGDEGPRSPAGLVRWSLQRGAASPERLDRSRSRRQASDWEKQEKERRQSEAAAAAADRQASAAAVADLPVGRLAELVDRVLARHADDPQMLRLLTAKPPPQSRLMQAAIATLLQEDEATA
jgi:hypothetical protein